ncbi:lysophospholipid acyltransferase family protein [Paenibacillus sp. CC-CFT747]|nr:lysophospholipid acyltransferase family protein [Paenibacillus sp. CC-CFT747]
MMEEKQLERYPFFRKIGAFSINRTSPRSIRDSLRYAETRLRHGGSIWLFPQGEIRHLEERPLAFQGGIGSLLERVPEAAAVPVTLYYSLAGHQKADASLLFGTPVMEDWRRLGRRAAAEELRRLLQSQLDGHRELALRAVAAEDGGAPCGFRPLMKPGVSTSDAFDSFKKRVGL